MDKVVVPKYRGYHSVAQQILRYFPNFIILNLIRKSAPPTMAANGLIQKTCPRNNCELNRSLSHYLKCESFR